MNIQIRKAKIDDINELAILKRQMWDETYRGIYSDDSIDNFDYNKARESFKKRIEDLNTTLIIVLDTNKIIGYMCFGVPYRKFQDYNQDIGLFYLLKDYQRQGIGGQLFNIAYTEIKSKGYKKFFISCNKYNSKARKFYEKMGGILVKEDLDNSDDKSIIQAYYHYDIK